MHGFSVQHNRRWRSKYQVVWWGPINRFNLVTCLCLSQVWTWIYNGIRRRMIWGEWWYFALLILVDTETMHKDHTLSQNWITTYSSCLEYPDLHFTRRYVCSLSSLIIVIGEESSRQSHQKHALSSCICRLSTCLIVEIAFQHVVSSYPTHDEVYSMQHYVTQVGGFFVGDFFGGGRATHFKKLVLNGK
jgi:hypothetical protein